MKVPQVPGLGRGLRIVCHKPCGYDPSARELTAFFPRHKPQSPKTEAVLRVVGNPGRVFLLVTEPSVSPCRAWALRQAYTLCVHLGHRETGFLQPRVIKMQRS